MTIKLWDKLLLFLLLIPTTCYTLTKLMKIRNFNWNCCQWLHLPPICCVNPSIISFIYCWYEFHLHNKTWMCFCIPFVLTYWRITCMWMYWCITCVWIYWCITHQMICSLHNDSLPLPNTRTIAPWQQNDHTDGTIADCSFLYVGRNEHIYIPYIQIYMSRSPRNIWRFYTRWVWISLLE